MLERIPKFCLKRMILADQKIASAKIFLEIMSKEQTSNGKRGLSLTLYFVSVVCLSIFLSVNRNQCDQIGRFIRVWATFQSL